MKDRNIRDQYLKRQIHDPRPDPGGNRQLPYIPGNFNSKESDWHTYPKPKRGQGPDWAGYGWIRPSPNGRIK